MRAWVEKKKINKGMRSEKSLFCGGAGRDKFGAEVGAGF